MKSDLNRIRRITFAVGPTKTVAHLDNNPSGSKDGYDEVRDPTQDAENVHFKPRDRYIDEEA
jgi:hypothetical protein